MDYTSIKVGQLPTGEISGGNFIPHEVAGVLKKATFTDLAAFIGANDAIGFRAVSVQNGGTLPTTDTQEFILVGAGTYNNVGGGSTITVTEELNALVSNGTYWFVGVQIPIDAPPGNAIWGQIIGTLSNQTDLKNILDLKADLVDGKVPASQLPSYVDDIIEVANYAALPTTGETGKIYLTLDNNKIYRWSGSVYIEIAAENAVWGQIVGTLSNQTDLQSALNAKVPYTGATANVDLGTHTLSSYNLVVNHASGSGVAASITKNGSGEALTVVKGSGSGNAASITGGVTLLSTLNLTNALADSFIASAATWNAKQNALTNPITGTGTTNYLPKFTGASALGNSQIFDNGTFVGIGRTTSFGAGFLLNVEGNIYATGDIIAGLRVSSPEFNVSSNNGIYSVGTNTVGFRTNNTEAMRITSGGNLLLGTTDTGFNARQLIRFEASGASTNGLAIWNGGGSGAVFTAFANSGGGFVGSITQIGTTGVAYNVTSDYRLKQDFKQFNGLDLVSKIKVYDYEWKADNSRMNGVIAHELQEVVPYAVTGEKDAKEMQQVDYSKLVPILVQAIQELKAEIETLKNK
jgi:hypothetical protein